MRLVMKIYTAVKRAYE